MSDRMPRIGVAGMHGHGATHVRAARELEREGRAMLVAAADHRPPDAELPGVAVLAGAHGWSRRGARSPSSALRGPSGPEQRVGANGAGRGGARRAVLDAGREERHHERELREPRRGVIPLDARSSP